MLWPMMVPSPREAADRPAGFSRTGWNAMVRQRFMNPPVFTYTPIVGAVKYRCVVKWKDAKGEARTVQMESAMPEFDLAKVWEEMPPPGPFQVAAGPVDAQGRVFANVDAVCQPDCSLQGPLPPGQA